MSCERVRVGRGRKMITERAMKPGHDYAKGFEFRLDLILDGLERLRE